MDEYAIPEKMSQERLSIACVRATVAHAGLNVATPDWDDGTDLLVGTSKAIESAPMNSYIGIQVKSTRKWRLSDDELRILWDVEVTTYNKLRAKSNVPLYLVLYIMPSDRETWVEYTDMKTSLLHAAYFLDLSDLPDTKNKRTKRISIPKENRLSRDALMELWRNHYVRKSP